MTARKPFQGTVNIMRFNAPVFGAGALTVLLSACAAWACWAAGWWVAACLAATTGATALLLSTGSLLASYLTYDRSGFYTWDWLMTLVPQRVDCVAHVHTGLDESTTVLKQKFADANFHVFDASDVSHETEPSIARARRMVPLDPATVHTGLGPLPVAAASVDLMVLPMAAHEVRDPRVRARWFRELGSALRPHGNMVVVEHVRDAANILAFHVGALHFLPRAAWLQTFDAGGLRLVKQVRLTALLTAFVLERR